MHPVLFRIGGVEVGTYYVLWTLALCLFILWTRRRATRRYGMDYDQVTSVLLWVFLGALVGARAGSYVDNWGHYSTHPGELLRFWEGGLSAGPAFLGGGLAGLLRLRRLGLSLAPFVEAASVPAAFLLAVGRVGCLGEGCCVGVTTTSSLGFHFLYDPEGVLRYPTQLFESLAGICIGVFLLLVEKLSGGDSPPSSRPAFLFPLSLILYGAYRFGMDFLRSGERVFPLFLVQYLGLIAVGMGLVWLFVSLRQLRRRNGLPRSTS
jgi:phosphatidylglycerol:prolipoprotein diacylglycerol transferase